MLRSIKELFGDKLGASDGEIGQRRNGYVALVMDEFGCILGFATVQNDRKLKSGANLVTGESLNGRH